MAVLLPVSILFASPELKIARGLLLVLLILSLLALLFHLHRRRRKEPGLGTSRAIWISSVAALAVLATVLVVSAGPQSEDVVAKVRNFYGVLTVRVDDAGDSEEEANILRSGVTIHGVQFRAEDRRKAPTSYYGEDSGVGWAVDESRKRIAGSRAGTGLRLGVVGLGVGTMAAYGQAGDTIRFYEINPLATQLATSSPYFSYIKDSAANVEIISGDARISMTRELERGERQNFDVLVLDAFTGDAIPVHLLTREAIAVYLQHLAPGGILAVHISNRFLDLEPVVHRAAAEFGLHSAWISNEDDKPLVYESDWILLSPDSHSLDSPELLERSEKTESTRRVRLWTDDYSNLFQVLAK
jgi:hypothetical protein